MLLAEHLADEVSFMAPAGGLALGLRLRRGISAESWALNAGRLGLSVLPGKHFALDGASSPASPISMKRIWSAPSLSSPRPSPDF